MTLQRPLAINGQPESRFSGENRGARVFFAHSCCTDSNEGQSDRNTFLDFIILYYIVFCFVLFLFLFSFVFCIRLNEYKVHVVI